VDRWSLAREAATGAYLGRAQSAQFLLEIEAIPTQPPLLQGDDGYSRKGPSAPRLIDQPPPASFYYSQPQLSLSARVRIEGDRNPEGAGPTRATGTGWLDHEWSSTYLPSQSSGWDWAGFNLYDGSALTAFQMRNAGAQPAGNRPAWFAYASLRATGAHPQMFSSAQVRFEPLQQWTSPRTRATYPVAQRIVVGSRTFETRPLMPDQELEPSGGFAYWEGASELLEGGRVVGRGYLELTGYAGAVPGVLGPPSQAAAGKPAGAISR
jgi:predicted secreted hydrolase